MIIGVDPGKEGGIAFLGSGEPTIIPMPILDSEIDFHELSRHFLNHLGEITMVVIEKVHAMPKNGAVSMFSFGKGYGALLGIVSALSLPYTLVTPRTWQKEMFMGVSGSDTKAKSIIAAKRLFPNTALRAANQRTDKDGFSDAILIAEFGRRNYSRVAKGA